MGFGLNSAGSEYGPTVNLEMNSLKGGEFLDRLGGCKLLNMYCPLRNQILTLQHRHVFCLLLGKPKILLRITDTEYFVYPAFPCVFAQRCKDFPSK